MHSEIIKAYSELLKRNHNIKFLWWLVSNLAELDNNTHNAIKNLRSNDEENLEQVLFRFLRRGSKFEIDKFYKLWKNREFELVNLK